jgi:hypothetical protein
MKRRIRRRDSIYTHEDYITHTERSSRTGRLSAEKVKTEQIINYKNWWPYSFKKLSCYTEEILRFLSNFASVMNFDTILCILEHLLSARLLT